MTTEIDQPVRKKRFLSTWCRLAVTHLAAFCIGVGCAASVLDAVADASFAWKTRDLVLKTAFTEGEHERWRAIVEAGFGSPKPAWWPVSEPPDEWFDAVSRALQESTTASPWYQHRLLEEIAESTRAADAARLLRLANDSDRDLWFQREANRAALSIARRGRYLGPRATHRRNNRGEEQQGHRSAQATAEHG